MNKKINIKQLQIDGIVQFKTERQLIKQGYLELNSIYKENLGDFINCEGNVYTYFKQLKDALGTVQKLHYKAFEEPHLVRIENGFYLPIEAIAK